MKAIFICRNHLFSFVEICIIGKVGNHILVGIFILGNTDSVLRFLAIVFLVLWWGDTPTHTSSEV